MKYVLLLKNSKFSVLYKLVDWDEKKRTSSQLKPKKWKQFDDFFLLAKLYNREREALTDFWHTKWEEEKFFGLHQKASALVGFGGSSSRAFLFSFSSG